MKKLLFFACLCGMLIGFASCDKKVKDKELVGSLFGVVTDKATGDPIRSAGVELLPIGKKAVTGNDGSFEFTNIDEGVYKLFITKTGYKDHTSNDIAVKASSKQTHSIQIEKLPPALRVVDENGQDITELDFGSEDGILMRSFSIFNTSEEDLEWSIEYACEWIASFSKKTGTLKPNASQPIVITINRQKLEAGTNTTAVHIVTNNGNKQLTVVATLAPLIETLSISDITPTSAVLNGRFNKQSSQPIIEYGFVYGTMPTPSLDNGASKITLQGTAQVGLFSSAISDLVYNMTYYVRAFAKTQSEIFYGDTKHFIAENLPYVIISSANLMVQKSDLSSVDWFSAQTMCKYSYVSGFSDWRLPSKEELMLLYTNRKTIGGFGTGSYWSSTVSDDNYYVIVINFAKGKEEVAGPNWGGGCVRAVRTIK